MEKNTLKFEKSRDFSDMLSVTFTFLKTEFKPLFKLLLTYVGPFLLITAFFTAWYQTKILDFSALTAAGSNSANPMDFYASIFSYKYALALLGTVVSTILMNLAVLAYIKLYKNEGRGNFELHEVWSIMKQKFFPVLGGSFLIGILFALGVFIIALFAIISKVLFAILMFAYIIIAIYFYVGFSLFIGALVFEDLPIVDSIKRSFFLVKNYWWLTVGITLVSSLISSIGQSIFSIPQMVIMGLTTFTQASGGEAFAGSSILMTIFTVIGTFGAYLLYVIPFTAIAVHFHNLVEKKENTSLLNKIEDIK